MSLVAGNVTGGGGKATTTKTYRHGNSRELRQECANNFGADRRRLAASVIGIQKNGRIERVHARFANLKREGGFGFLKI
jgi:hypothetical protein